MLCGLIIVSNISAMQSIVKYILDVLNSLIEFADVGCFDNFMLKYIIYMVKIIDNIVYVIPADLNG